MIDCGFKSEGDNNHKLTGAFQCGGYVLVSMQKASVRPVRFAVYFTKYAANDKCSQGGLITSRSSTLRCVNTFAILLLPYVVPSNGMHHIKRTSLS